MVNSQSIVLQIYIILVFFTVLKPNIGYAGIRKYTKDDLVKLREEVREMFNHAYSGYLKYAYPYDELRPLTCDGVDTWGSYSLTLIDALDTLAVMGNYSEFRRVVDIVTSKANFDANINVSVFETNIRIVGGLLSAHMLSQRAGVDLEPGWPCNGPLLRLAEDVARRLLAAFDTATGMPYGTVNLRHGVPPGETAVTCAAGVGTFMLEFAALSRLTGDPVYEEVALNALHALYHHRSSIGLYGNHIDVMSGRWTAQDSGIGAGVDSFFEYLVKGALLTQRPELMVMFHEARASIDKYLKRNDWYLWASMHKGQVTLPVFQSLEAYWPGVLSLIGDISAALKSMHNYHQVWKQYGFTPEFYNIPQGQVGTNRESYPLRPELIESAMYLYRATGDPFLLDVGTDILRSIQHSARTKCGYATIKDCRDHSLENRMESFFLAETTKYLYLLFDTDNFIHNDGGKGLIHTLPSGRQCILDAGGYIFNTEAHPLDPGTLLCCSENIEDKKHKRRKAHGVKLNSFARSVQETPSPADNLQTDESEQILSQLPSALTEEAESLKKENQENVEDITSDIEGTNNNLSVEKIQPSILDNSMLTLDKLKMVETLINTDLENPLKKTTWSRDLLEELVRVIENAEAKVFKSKKTVVEKIETRPLEPGNTKHKDQPFNNIDQNLYITDQNDLKSIISKESTVDNDIIKPDMQSEGDKSIISEVISQPITSRSVESDFNLIKSSSDHDNEKGNKLFDVIITQQFQTITSTISIEADVIMLNIHKCLENINLTKDLMDIAVEHELETQFFTKRLKIRDLAVQLTKTVDETKKFLVMGESEDTVSLEFFKELVASVVDGNTVRGFLDEYKSYLELSKTLIELEKEKHSDFGKKKSASSDGGDLHDSDDDDGIKQIHGNGISKSDVQNRNWKTDSISYEVDDRERVTPVTTVDSGQPLFSEKVATSPVDDLIGYLSKSLVPNETPFNPQVLLERIRLSQRYPRNETWMTKYELLTCLPQPYLTRITLSGEFFDES